MLIDMKPTKKHHRSVDTALSLDKFASAKASTYDKRKAIAKQQALKAKQVNKYKKLKKRLEAEGVLEPGPQLVSFPGWQRICRARLVCEKVLVMHAARDPRCAWYLR